MEVRRLRTLALENFKTSNDLNPVLMKNLFTKRKVSKRRKNNLEIPHICNDLPEEIKNENSYDMFKEYLNTWYVPKCTCSLCPFTEVNISIETKPFP